MDSVQPESLNDPRRNFQKSEEQPSNTNFFHSCCTMFLFIPSILLILIFLPFSLMFCIKIVTEYERAVIFRLGKVKGGDKGPGLFFILPCLDTFRKIDLRTVSYKIPTQEILSRDSVTVAVDAVVYYRIYNASNSVINVRHVESSTQLLAQTTLRTVLGMQNLTDILSDRDRICHCVEEQLKEPTKLWGVKVERIELKDVQLPISMQRAMAAEAEAFREAKAKIVSAEGEQKASVALMEAASILGKHPGAIQLRYMQTLSHIAAENNSTIIFPLPIDMLSAFQKGAFKSD